MMSVPRDSGDYQIHQWTPEAFNAYIQFMKDLNLDLVKSGELVDAQALTQPGQAKIVRWERVDRQSYRMDRSVVDHQRGAAERSASLPERNYLLAKAARLTGRD